MPTGQGKHTCRLLIQKRDESTTTAGGNPDPTWTDKKRRWAAIMTKGRIQGKEWIDANQTHDESTMIVEFPWNDTLIRTVTPKDRFKDIETGRILEVTVAFNFDRKRAPLFECKELNRS